MQLLRVLAAAVSLALCVAAKAEGEIHVRQTIYFDPNSVEMSVVPKEIVHDLAEVIIDREVKRVVVVGHSDTAEKAPTLSSRYRAKAVADHLRASGVPPTVTIEYRGVGANDLAVKTGPNVHHPANRRATIAY
jgi:outer membrane protein OmpA-like peptidoglycan-associated protein